MMILKYTGAVYNWGGNAAKGKRNIYTQVYKLLTM